MERLVQPQMCLEKEFQREGAAMEKTLSPWSCAWSWMLETGGWRQRSQGCGKRCGSIAGPWSGYAGLCEWGEGHWIESVVRQGANGGSGGKGWCGWRSRSGYLTTTCFLSLFYYGDGMSQILVCGRYVLLTYCILLILPIQIKLQKIHQANTVMIKKNNTTKQVPQVQRYFLVSLKKHH